MAVMKIDTDQIRSDASDYAQRAASIASTSKATKGLVESLVGANFTGKDGLAMNESFSVLDVALANITEILETLSQNMRAVAGNFDETESSNAAGLRIGG